MIFLAGTLAVGLVSALGVVAWLVYRTIAAGEDKADARVAQVATEAELERVKYEHEVTKRALDAAHARAFALEEAINGHLNEEPNPDLSRGDVMGRVLRIAKRWADAEADRNAPATDEGVPDEPAPDSTPVESLP